LNSCTGHLQIKNYTYIVVVLVHSDAVVLVELVEGVVGFEVVNIGEVVGFEVVVKVDGFAVVEDDKVVKTLEQGVLVVRTLVKLLDVLFVLALDE
jgi:hypothetical protein